LTEEVIRIRELVRDIEAYLADCNANPKRYEWRAEGAEITPSPARAALDKAAAEAVNGRPL
jgi:hypothetical protein